jgi:hypothetical protein
MAFRLIAAAVALILGSTACGFGRQSSSAPTIGDSCVVGSWVLTEQTNQSGYTYAGVPVAVAGLAGATLTLTASGEEKESFDGSAPLVGTLSNGVRLAITIRGSIDYKIHAASGKYQETGAVVQLPTTATAGGAAVADYHSSYSPGRGTYSCAGGGLTITTEGGNQTDVWSKG